MQKSSSPKPACIAVINDDTAFLDLMRDLLETDGGYEAVICREWEDAHAFVKDQRPRAGNSGHPHRWTGARLDHT